MKSFSIKAKDVHYKWYYVDANKKILGRLATHISVILRGKHKPTYTPHMDNGDYIIVINAKKIVVTGTKLKNKYYFYHTGYVGGIKKISFQSMILKNPEKIIQNAVKGMLPKNSLGRIIFNKLKVYPYENHPHEAQKPEFLNI